MGGALAHLCNPCRQVGMLLIGHIGRSYHLDLRTKLWIRNRGSSVTISILAPSIDAGVLSPEVCAAGDGSSVPYLHSFINNLAQLP